MRPRNFYRYPMPKNLAQWNEDIIERATSLSLLLPNAVHRSETEQFAHIHETQQIDGVLQRYMGAIGYALAQLARGGNEAAFTLLKSHDLLVEVGDDPVQTVLDLLAPLEPEPDAIRTVGPLARLQQTAIKRKSLLDAVRADNELHCLHGGLDEAINLTRFPPKSLAQHIQDLTRMSTIQEAIDLLRKDEYAQATVLRTCIAGVHFTRDALCSILEQVSEKLSLEDREALERIHFTQDAFRMEANEIMNNPELHTQSALDAKKLASMVGFHVLMKKFDGLYSILARQSAVRVQLKSAIGIWFDEAMYEAFLSDE